MTSALVYRLVKESKAQPEKLRDKKEQEKKEINESKAITDIASDMLERSITIQKAATVKIKAR